MFGVYGAGGRRSPAPRAVGAGGAAAMTVRHSARLSDTEKLPPARQVSCRAAARCYNFLHLAQSHHRARHRVSIQDQYVYWLPAVTK